MSLEIWKPHPISGYLISNTGRIINPKTNYELNPTLGSHGYYKIGTRVCRAGHVHCAVVEAFIGLIPKGMHVNHIDGVKTNNHLSNLEIVTPSQNTIHAYAMGLAKGRKGEENSRAKVTKEHVLGMYSLFELGYNNEYVAEKTGLHSRYVSLVRHGKRWTWLYDEVGKTFPKSFSSGAYRLTRVIEAWEMLKVGYTNKQVADACEIEASNISRLRSRQLWKDFIDFYESRSQHTGIYEEITRENLTSP